MNVLIFGATGMVGQGVLRECLLEPNVKAVRTVGRTAAGGQHPKLTEIIHRDFSEFNSIESQLTAIDACFFCLGTSSSGMTEADYERVTFGFTMAAAATLHRLNPKMTFVYVSGMGTDSTERGRLMWAWIKGRTENAVLRLFESSYMFRPGFIQPLDGIKSKTAVYRVFYVVLQPLMTPLRWLLPNQILTTRIIGRAMLNVAAHGYPKRILESKDIREAAAH